MPPLVLAGCTIASESTSWPLCRNKTIQKFRDVEELFETCHDGRYQVRPRQFDELSRIPCKLMGSNKQRITYNQYTISPLDACHPKKKHGSVFEEILSAPEYADLVKVVTESLSYELFLDLISQHQSVMAQLAASFHGH